MASRRKVLAVVLDLADGGVQRVVSTILQHLDRSLFEPGLLMWRDRRSYAIPDDVPVWALNRYGRGQTPAVVWETARLIRHWKPDVVFPHLGFVTLVTGAAVIASGSACTFLPYMHMTPRSECTHVPFLVYRAIWRRARAVLACSRTLQGMLVSEMKLPADKVRAIYCPQDLRSLKFTSPEVRRSAGGRPQIVSIGRLSPEKDHALLVRAFARLRRQMDAELVLAGDGPCRADLERLARDLGVAEDVRLLGWCADVAAVLREASVFALPSREESFGLALIEAMASGVPCVATRCAGPCELIRHESNGLLVEVGSEEQLALALKRMIADPGLCDCLAERGAAFVSETFHLPRQMTALETALAEE